MTLCLRWVWLFVVQTYAPKVTPVCACSLFFIILSGRVINVSISCKQQHTSICPVKKTTRGWLQELFLTLTRWAPLDARMAPSSSAVQFSGTSWSSWFRMGPTSNLHVKTVFIYSSFVIFQSESLDSCLAHLSGRICMMVTPVAASPCRMVWKTGAGPLHLGNRLGWTFKIPL